MRRILLPLVALLVAGASTFAVRGWLERGKPPEQASPAEKQLKAVLVAAAGLPVGSFVQPDGLRWQEWPDVAVPDSYLVRGRNNKADLVGAVVRRPISAESMVKPGDRGFLAAVLDP